MDTKTGEMFKAEDFAEMEELQKQRMVSVPDETKEPKAHAAIMAWSRALKAQSKNKKKRNRKRRKAATESRRRNR